VTRHLNSPGTPTSCSTCLEGPHNGLRLEDQYKPLLQDIKYSIWDIAPMYNSTAQAGMLVIGTGKTNNPYSIEGKLMLLDNGKIGIGTANPQATLDVNTTGGNFTFDGSGSAGYTTHFGMDNTGLKIGHNSKYRDIEFSIFNTKVMTLLASGKVGIGVDEAKMTDNNNFGYKLYVGGGIIAERCRIALQSSTDWGDWVFDENNKRMTFDEQFTFYNENKHLKGIPSASVLKTSGIDVSEMFAGIVINLEEARLDNIALNKKNQEQKKEIDDMKAQMKKLQQQMEKLEGRK